MTNSVRSTAIFVTLALLLFSISVTLQPASAQVPGRCEVPASQRTGENGCYVSATVPLGELPATRLFWHLYTYQNRAAAEAISGAKITVVEAFEKVWLFAIAEEGWRASNGERVAMLGPLRTHPGKLYTAHYVEAVFPPGMKTAVHFHHGSEASYVVAGAECVETPDGKMVNKTGQGAVVAEHTPMQLSNPGSETRKAVALILHEQTHHWSTLTRDWTPKDLCNE